MLGINLALWQAALQGGGAASTPENEIVWDDGDFLAWDDGTFAAWDD